MKKIRLSKRTVLRCLALPALMLLANCALPGHEPLSFALLYAAVFCGTDPFVAAGSHLLASLPSLSLAASLSAAVQSGSLLLAAVLYRRTGRRPGPERMLCALVGQLPFVFLFPHEGYALPLSPLVQKLLLAAGILLFSLLFEGAYYALERRIFRTRLTAVELMEIALLWLVLGMGMLSSVGEPVFLLVALSALLFGTVLGKTAASTVFAAVLSLPLCVMRASLTPLAAFFLFSATALLLLPYGRAAASLSLIPAFCLGALVSGLFSAPWPEVVLTLLACALPAVFCAFVPEKLLGSAEKTLLFYRERTLPRIAVNRARRAVGEQLYEVSSLFREIEGAFSREDADRSAEHIRDKVFSSLCRDCPERPSCVQGGLTDGLEKLIAVGIAKGKVNLIDLPIELSARCRNASGLLFALNKQLAEYGRMNAELEAARDGRRLLAQQAHGVSELLRGIALDQSEEYVFSGEEDRLAAALAKEGILSSEIFLYGEGTRFTASMTLKSDVSGKKLCRVASAALHTPLALAEKLPLTKENACYILRKKPLYDAAFGIAALPKENEIASGDTHSILKIDERRFLAALSDGMGSGEAARTVSDRTLSLIEAFYKAGMPSDTILSTVNSLVAFSSEETFSCLDVAAVDLDTGVADVVKIGSPVGFVLSGETLQVLEGESLPIGALEAVRPACMRVAMKPDDFLIFMSDGVTSAFGSSSDLVAYLSALHPLNPQSLAEEILQKAVGRYRGRAEDDMTVLTVKLILP